MIRLQYCQRCDDFQNHDLVKARDIGPYSTKVTLQCQVCQKSKEREFYDWELDTKDQQQKHNDNR